MKAPAANLDLAQFQTAVKSARERFSRIRQKYPALKAYLVLSLPRGQAGIGSSPREILNHLPSLVVDDEAKARVTSFLAMPATKDASEAEKKKREEQIEELAVILRYDGACQVEIRFDALNYDLIGQLQTDELVDRDLTPQTKASIRIVLGTLAQLAES